MIIRQAIFIISTYITNLNAEISWIISIVLLKCVSRQSPLNSPNIVTFSWCINHYQYTGISPVCIKHWRIYRESYRNIFSDLRTKSSTTPYYVTRGRIYMRIHIRSSRIFRILRSIGIMIINHSNVLHYIVNLIIHDYIIKFFSRRVTYQYVVKYLNLLIP